MHVLLYRCLLVCLPVYLHLSSCRCFSQSPPRSPYPKQGHRLETELSLPHQDLGKCRSKPSGGSDGGVASLSVDTAGGEDDRDMSSHTVTLRGRGISSGDGGGGGCDDGGDGSVIEGDRVHERESERERGEKRAVSEPGRGESQIWWRGGGGGDQGGEYWGEDERASAGRVVFEPLPSLHVAMFSYAQVRKRT